MPHPSKPVSMLEALKSLSKENHPDHSNQTPSEAPETSVDSSPLKSSMRNAPSSLPLLKEQKKIVRFDTAEADAYKAEKKVEKKTEKRMKRRLKNEEKRRKKNGTGGGNFWKQGDESALTDPEKAVDNDNHEDKEEEDVGNIGFSGENDPMSPREAKKRDMGWWVDVVGDKRILKETLEPSRRL